MLIDFISCLFSCGILVHRILQVLATTTWIPPALWIPCPTYHQALPILVLTTSRLLALPLPDPEPLGHILDALTLALPQVD